MTGEAEPITVSVDDEHLAEIDAVAARLQEAGMQVEQVLPGIGVITGTVPGAQRTALATVAGVAGVEPQRTYRLPPPDADVQ